MTNTKNHSKYGSYVSICPRNCFSPLTWLSSLLQLLSDGDLVSLHLWRRMSEMKCSVSAQKEGKKVFNGRAENVTRDVCIAPQAHNSVLKYRCQEQAGVCIGKIRIWTWTKSPGVCVLSPTDVQGHVSWCVCWGWARSLCRTAYCTEAEPLETIVVLAASAPSAGNSKPTFLPFPLHPRTILKHYPDLEGMVILSFTFTTFNSFWGDLIPLLPHFYLIEAQEQNSLWIFFQAQM